MGRRPLIGLFPSFGTEEKQQTVYLRYVSAVEKTGGAPFVLPLTENTEVLTQMASLCDGVLFTGGDDMHPSLYGCCLHEHCGTLTPVRDRCETKFAEIYLKTGKPYLGICRGIQFLNVMYGGTLYQDIPAEYNRQSVHRQPKPYDVPFHKVRLTEGGRLAALLGKTEISVNSMHHQCVKKLGAGLAAEGFAEDGVLEAFSDPARAYGIAVQWHPEHLVGKDDEASLLLFNSFVEACEKAKL